MANKTSQHILGTSANLLGFCLFIITSLHLTNKTENNLIDEFTSIVALLLTVSSVFSFISIRTENKKREYLFETIADYLFIISLIGIFGIIVFIIINFWQK
jgi:predicted membrane channel-forming protein YqfA (hemolysin III family)